MASKESSVPEQLLQSLSKLARQMQEPGLCAAKIEQITGRAEQYVGLFAQYSECLEEAQKESSDSLAQKQAELERRENGLKEAQAAIDEARAALTSEETLVQLGVNLGQARAQVTESEGRLAAALETCSDKLEKAVTARSEWCDIRLTEVMASCEENLAKKVDDTLAAVSSCEGKVEELSDKTTQSVSCCQQAVLGQVSSCEEALGEKLDRAVRSWSTDLAAMGDQVRAVTSPDGQLMRSVGGFKGFVGEMGDLLSGHMDGMSLKTEELGQKVADTGARVDSVLASESKKLVKEVKASLAQSAVEYSSALNDARTQFAQDMGEDRLSTIFQSSARADEILGRIEEVREAASKPDTSVSEAVSELKGMLQGLTSSSQREGVLAKALENAQDEAKVVRAELKTCREERDRLASEVGRLNSDMDQLKTKLPTTPRRSERDPASDESEWSLGFEQEMAKAADAVEQPSGPSVGDLQQRIKELEEELRLSKESRQRAAEDSAYKKYLDDALANMTQTLSLRDRNEVQAAREEQANQVAELERKLRESAKRADEAEKKSADLQGRVGELAGQVVTLENERDTAAPGENGARSRKRVRLLQGSSNSSEIPDETLFSSMCSAIHEAMDKVKIGQSDQPGLPVAEIVTNMTRAFAYIDREERLVRFITADQTGKLSCFGSLVLSDDPSSRDCKCHQLQGGMVNHCLSLRVLDNATMEVEFGLVDLES